MSYRVARSTARYVFEAYFDGRSRGNVFVFKGCVQDVALAAIILFLNSSSRFYPQNAILPIMRLRSGACTNVSLITNANHLIIRAGFCAHDRNTALSSSRSYVTLINARWKRARFAIDCGNRQFTFGIPGEQRNVYRGAIAGRYIYGTFPDSGTDPLMSYWIRNQRESTTTRAFAAASRWNVWWEVVSERTRLQNQKQCNSLRIIVSKSIIFFQDIETNVRFSSNWKDFLKISQKYVIWYNKRSFIQKILSSRNLFFWDSRRIWNQKYN